MRKSIFNSLFALLLLCVTSISVFAHEVPDFNKSGSITVNLEYDGKLLSSGTLTFYRVGDLVSTNGDYHFRKTEEFASFDGTLEDVRSPQLAKSLLDYATAQNISGETAPIQDGAVYHKIEANRLGLYLVAQHEATTGYNLLDPFLVAVPNWEDNAYVYDVNATPKVGTITETIPTVPPTQQPTDPVLPQTGQVKLPIPILVIAGLALIGSGLLIRFNAKKDYEN